MWIRRIMIAAIGALIVPIGFAAELPRPDASVDRHGTLAASTVITPALPDRPGAPASADVDAMRASLAESRWLPPRQMWR